MLRESSGGGSISEGARELAAIDGLELACVIVIIDLCV